MSGFFGIFSPTDNSIDLEAFEQMRKASDREGFDGMETVVEDNIVMGHLMLRVSPESKYDKQPLRSACGKYLLVGHFRLDYRDELGDKLGLIQSELESTPDSVLVMMAYQKWKEKCVNHLEGDWAFALIDLVNNDLFLAKDQAGHSALYFRKEGEVIYFSSAPKVLCDVGGLRAKVNGKHLMAYVAFDFLPTSGNTFMQNIFYVKCAHYIFIRSDFSSVEIKYWQIQIATTKFKFGDDYIHSLHSLFSLAVKSRTDSVFSPGLFLSSGLDSSAVAYYAANELLNQKKHLTTYTSYPLFLDLIDPNEHIRVNEAPLVNGFVGQFQNVESNYLNFPNEDVLSGIEASSDDIIYPFKTINTFWIDGIMNAAKTNNNLRVLNGQMGNSIISWDGPMILSSLLLRFRILTLLKQLIYISRVQKKSILVIFYRLVINDFIRFFLVKKKYFHFRYFNNKQQSAVFEKLQSYKTDYGFGEISFLKDQFAFYFNSKKMRLRQFFSSVEFAGMRWYNNGHLFAVETADPTSDIRLVNFSFSLPETLFMRNGTKKYIYKKWMEDKLTKEILEKEHRIMQSADFGLRLSKSNLVQSISINLNVHENNVGFKTDIVKLLGRLISEMDFRRKRAIAAQILKQMSVNTFLKLYEINL